MARSYDLRAAAVRCPHERDIFYVRSYKPTKTLVYATADPFRERPVLMTYNFLTVEDFDDGQIVRVTLNRPEVRNAQNRGLLVELNQALLEAEADDAVRVVILAGAGPAFSSGHDIGSALSREEREPGEKQHPTRRINGGTRSATENRFLQEWHYYFENTKRWRSLRKITVAQVQGTVYAGGLMLAWACDLIIAADDARFADVVGTRLGMCGVEYFAHPWEFGPRLAKELMLTGDSLTAEKAYAVGMVSDVVEPSNLPEATLAWARRIAKLPTVTALLIKESVNQTMDIMGFSNALSACFSLHQMNHAHWAELTHGERIVGTPEYGVPDWRDAPPVRTREDARAGG
jgi:enoyl-CoA hydratase